MFYVKLAIRKLNSHKSLDIDKIPAELIKAGEEQFAVRSINFISSFWNKEELTEEWKQSIGVPVYWKGDITDCTNYCDISLCTITYTILSNILLSRLTVYAEEIIGDHQCGL